MHPTGGSLRVFRHFAWLEAGSVKMALPRPAHQRVTQAVSPLNTMTMRKLIFQIKLRKFLKMILQTFKVLVFGKVSVKRF